MKKHILTAALATSLLICAGCTAAPSFFGGQKKEVAYEAGVVPYSADSLRNYKEARDFAAQGRYELAREHYLLALAATTDPYLQDALAHELESVDMMIKTLR